MQSVDLSSVQFVQYSLWLSVEMTRTTCTVRARVSAPAREHPSSQWPNPLAHEASAILCAYVCRGSFPRNAEFECSSDCACGVADRWLECCAPSAYIVRGGNGRELRRGLRRPTQSGEGGSGRRIRITSLPLLLCCSAFRCRKLRVFCAFR